jgi:hypothetical protein
MVFQFSLIWQAANPGLAQQGEAGGDSIIAPVGALGTMEDFDRIIYDRIIENGMSCGLFNGSVKNGSVNCAGMRTRAKARRASSTDHGLQTTDNPSSPLGLWDEDAG